MNEFPKALYRKGWADLTDVQTANNPDEEGRLRQQGYRDLSSFTKPGEDEQAVAEAKARGERDEEDLRAQVIALQQNLDAVTRRAEEAEKAGDKASDAILRAAEDNGRALAASRDERDAAVKRAEAAERERDELRGQVEALTAPKPGGEALAEGAKKAETAESAQAGPARGPATVKSRP